MRKSVRAQLAALAVAASLALGGCAEMRGAVATVNEYADTAAQIKRDQSDAEARIVKNAPCVMTLGAYHRTTSSQERAALSVLCGGDLDPETLSDLNQ